MSESFYLAHACDSNRDVSLLAHDQYMREVTYRERLSFEQQACLFQRMARHSHHPENAWLASLAQDARARLVEEYQSLVIAIARRWQSSCTSMQVDDLIQEGNLGLLQVMDWVVSHEDWASFAGMAARAIGWAVWDAYMNRERFVRYSATVEKDLYHLHVAEHQVEARTLTDSSTRAEVAEVAAWMQVSEQRVRTLLALRRQARVESVQALVASSLHAQDDYLVFRPLFADGWQEGTTGQEPASQEPTARAQAVQHAMTLLTARQEQVIRLRWGLTEGDATEYSLGQIAARLGMSCQCVQTHERRAKARLAQVLQATAPGNVVKKGRGILLLDVQDRSYYTIEEVSQRLGVCELTVRRRVKQGQLPCDYCPGEVMKYRFPKPAIDALVGAAVAREEVG
ncbi:MAG: sigma-70 family RNA polymerase sigma factor [Ktedonobacteraceae bacterium]